MEKSKLHEIIRRSGEDIKVFLTETGNGDGLKILEKFQREIAAEDKLKLRNRSKKEVGKFFRVKYPWSTQVLTFLKITGIDLSTSDLKVDRIKISKTSAGKVESIEIMEDDTLEVLRDEGKYWKDSPNLEVIEIPESEYTNLKTRINEY